jgi:hypothetical protein
MNSKFSLTTPFSCFYDWIRLPADVRTIGGGQPVLAGAAASRGVASVFGRIRVQVRCSERGEEVPGGDLLGGGACLRRFMLLSLKLGQSHLCCAAWASGII